MNQSFFCLFVFLQVLRNHELVGQIRLDELEARLEQTIPEEDHTVPNKSAIIDCDNVSIGTQTKTVAKVEMDLKHLEDKDTPLNPAQLKDSEQEDPQQAKSNTRVEKETEAKEVENVNCQTVENINQIQENQIQLKSGNIEENGVRNSGLKEKVVQLFEGSPDKIPRFPPRQRVFNDAKIEEHILRSVLPLQKDNSAVTKHRKSELDLSVKETVLAHNLLFKNTLKLNPTKLDGVQSQSKSSFRRHSLTHGVYNAQRKFSSGGVPFTAKQIENPGRREKVDGGKNKGLAEEGHLISRCSEKDHGTNEATHPSKKLRYEDDGAIKRTDNPHTSEGRH